MKGLRFVRGLLTATVLGAIVGACASPPPVAVTFDTLEQHAAGTTVVLSGDLGLVDHFEYGNDISAVRLIDPDGGGSVWVWITHRDSGRESQPNRMEPLGLSYGPEDLIVWRNDGSTALIGERITVTGALRYTDGGSPYIHPVTLIEG